MHNPDTSVVVRTFNEQKYLPDLLRAIKTQSYSECEVIVVDSGSYDGTPEIAEQHGARVLRIHSRDFTFGYSLNVGIRHGTGRYIAIVSAHALPVSAAWLQLLLTPFRDEAVAMVYGKQVGGPTSKFAEAQDFRRMFEKRRMILAPRRFLANNANSAIRRDLWEQHPFDESLPGLEDIEWAKHWTERGYLIVYEPSATVYHLHEETWRQVRRRYYREAMAARWIGIKGQLHIPLEVLREGRNLLEDLLQASRQGHLHDKASEIFLFRTNKAWGTARGLWDGAAIEDPRKREAMLFDRSYRAVVIHGPRRAVLEEIELSPLKPGDVLIKVAYVGVCATDLEIFEGTLGYYKSGLATYPIVPGHEFSGHIVKVGSNVSHLREGDPVVAEPLQSCGQCAECRRGNIVACTERREIGVIGRDGAYAEYLVLPGEYVHKLPDDQDLRSACLCEPLAVVLKGLKRLERVWGAGDRKRCAIVGVGPIGHLCALVVRSRGHDVTVFDRNPVRAEYFVRTDPLVRAATDLDTLSNYEVVIEATGDPEALDVILHKSAPSSALLLLGLPYAKREFSFESIVAYDKTIIGSVGSAAEDLQEAIALLPRLNLAPFIEIAFRLDEFRTAWEACRSRRYLKVILEVDASLRSDARESLRRGGVRAAAPD